jgi:hypothetical protein
MLYALSDFPYIYNVSASYELAALVTVEVMWRDRNYFSILRSGMREFCLVLALTTVKPLHREIDAIITSSIPMGCPAKNS